MKKSTKIFLVITIIAIVIIGFQVFLLEKVGLSPFPIQVKSGSLEDKITAFVAENNETYLNLLDFTCPDIHCETYISYWKRYLQENYGVTENYIKDHIKIEKVFVDQPNSTDFVEINYFLNIDWMTIKRRDELISNYYFHYYQKDTDPNFNNIKNQPISYDSFLLMMRDKIVKSDPPLNIIPIEHLYFSDFASALENLKSKIGGELIKSYGIQTDFLYFGEPFYGFDPGTPVLFGTYKEGRPGDDECKDITVVLNLVNGDSFRKEDGCFLPI